MFAARRLVEAPGKTGAVVRIIERLECSAMVVPLRGGSHRRRRRGRDETVDDHVAQVSALQ
ncbi:MAG: hypothetical protein Ct9H300mP1_05870 [Planctomycetaceae bacterium]|nr:MAG: hypothetical protein Ct9H300mP1_05870 [Planctomycetaceae bacterium]